MSRPCRIRATLRAIDVRHCRSSILRTRTGFLSTVLALWAGVLLPLRGARALDLIWDAPESCPDRGAVLAQLQRRQNASEDAGWSVQARVTRTRGRYTLDLTLRGPNESLARRTLHASSCAALAETTVVMVALAVESSSAADGGSSVPVADPDAISGSPTPTADPDAISGSPAPVADSDAISGSATSPDTSPTSSITTKEAARPTSTLAPAHDQHAASAARFGFEVGASLALRAGMLVGGPRLGLRPELALRFARLRAAVAADLWLGGESEAHAYPSATLQDHALGADVTIGVDLTQTHFRPRPCLALELAEITLKTSGITAPAETRAGWVALGAGMQLEALVLAGLRVSVDAFGFLPVEPAQFLVQTTRGRVELFRPSPLGVRASLGVAYVIQ